MRPVELPCFVSLQSCVRQIKLNSTLYSSLCSAACTLQTYVSFSTILYVSLRFITCIKMNRPNRQQNAAFFRLPAELRNPIYQSLFFPPNRPAPVPIYIYRDCTNPSDVHPKNRRPAHDMDNDCEHCDNERPIRWIMPNPDNTSRASNVPTDLNVALLAQNAHIQQLAILGTCQRMYREAGSFFYARILIRTARATNINNGSFKDDRKMNLEHEIYGPFSRLDRSMGSTMGSRNRYTSFAAELEIYNV